jgi:hypothetical protein
MIGVLVLVALYFSTNFRRRMGQVLAIGFAGAQGFWNIARRWIIVALIVSVVLWILFVVIFTVTGNMVNSGMSGFLFGIFFPFWFFFFIMPAGVNRVPFLGKMTIFSKWVLTPVIAICFLNLLIGLWSPAVKGSFDGWASNKKQEIASAFDKSSVQSEPESGMFAKLSEKATIYSQREGGNPIADLPDGEVVLVLGISERQKVTETEGRVRVRLSDQYGDFNGKFGWVPARKLEWNWKRKAEVVPASYSPPEPTTQTIPAPAFIQPPVQTARLPGEEQVAPAPPPPPKELNIQTNKLWTIQMLAHQEIWAQYYPSGGIIVRGDWIDGQYILRMQFGWAPPVIARLKRTGPKRLEGCWSQYVGPGYGEIVIDFLDERGGNGTVTWKGVEVPFQITSI